ncbi:ABC transporter permease, partial [Photobacterium sanctipauli]
MLIKLAWRNLWRNKLRTGIMLGAMVFGLFGVVGIIGFISGLYGNMIQNAIAWQTSHIQIHHQAYLDDPDIKNTVVDLPEIEAAIKQLPNLKGSSSRFIADGMIASARSTRGVRMNGIDINGEASVAPIASSIQQGEWLDEQGRNPVLVSEKTAGRLKLRVGSKVVLTFTDANGDVSGAVFRVRGIFKTPSTSFDDSNVYVRRGDLMALAGIEGAHEIAILLESDDAAAQTAKHLQAAISSDNTARDWKVVQPMLASIINQQGTSNAIMLGIFVLAMGFGIVNIMLMSVFERTREFGVLMAVGMQKHRIFTLILLETALLGITGAVLGLIVSMVTIAVLGNTG